MYYYFCDECWHYHASEEEMIICTVCDVESLVQITEEDYDKYAPLYDDMSSHYTNSWW